MAILQKVLVVGGTGQVGGLVIDELLKLKKQVYALVRPTSNAEKLTAKGVTVVRGDMLDLASLERAMTGMDAVITTAAGYTQHSKGDTTDTDTLGNRNLVDAAAKTGIKRFVLTSILTADQTPQVPHFWHKKLVEDYLVEKKVPFVALRPGAFLDDLIKAEGPDGAVRVLSMGSKNLHLTFVLSSQIAHFLALAVDADVANGERIDIGWNQPVSALELQRTASKLLKKKASLLVIPFWLMSSLGSVVGLFSPLIKDMVAMVRWFQTGKYVANPKRQGEAFGSVPTAEESLRELLRQRGYGV